MEPQYASVEAVVDALAPSYPVYCLRPAALAHQVRRFRAQLPGTVLYAVKCNPHPVVLDTLVAAGITDFDVASLPEIALIAGRYPGARAYFMHPVKARDAIRAAYARYGVRHFVVDHPDELDKLMTEIPARDLTIVVRLKTAPDPSTVYDLSTKFGCDPDTGAALLDAIHAAGCHSGIAFHVGSQCGAPPAYVTALAEVGALVRRSGRWPQLIDVGGGFPAPYVGSEVPPLDAYMDALRAGLAALAPPASTSILAEPGRALVADACSLIVQVQLRKGRALYLNDGIFGSLAEMALSSLRMPVRPVRARDAAAPRVPFTLYGPTCDGLDVLPGEFLLPDDLREGDWLEVAQIGAYSNALVTRFNGFHPETLVTVGD